MCKSKKTCFVKCMKFEDEYKKKHGRWPLYIFGLSHEGYFSELQICEQNQMRISFIGKQEKPMVKTYDLNKGYEITIRLGID